ncbi:hypothetical protein PR001_g17715 [Phytophthora rubi]|uniref:Uncharacterized protein n=1 Tax=Phytophthora rubi TaxID=129364 RepID=A0A6A3KFU0_9STRA|nr:hypothetical protein PR001_g17715 [Phytophthora rubi]
MGKDGMLAMWVGSSSGGDLQQGGDRTIYAQVLNRATGKAISSKVTVDKQPGTARCGASTGWCFHYSKGLKATGHSVGWYFHYNKGLKAVR